MIEENSLRGKKALLVGGSGGIGREISLKLAKYGTNLIIHGSQKSEKILQLEKEIYNICGKKPDFVFQDLLNNPFEEVSNSALLKSAEACDILCVCFGPFVQKSLHETTIFDWQQVSLFDYALPGLLISKALPGMMKNHFGRILLFGGTGTFHRQEFSTNAAYAGAKSGLNVLVSSVAASYAQYGVTCNAILPGFTETEYTSEFQKKELADKMPLKRMINPEELAEKSLFLLKNADINGSSLRVDQGWSPSQNSTK